MNASHRYLKGERGRARRGAVGLLSSDATFRRTALVWFAGLLAVSLIIVGLGVALVHEREKSRRLAALKADEQGIADAQLGAVHDHLTRIRSDLLFLRDEYESVFEAANGDPRRTAADITQRYRNFSKARDVYDAIRIINADGREAVRINHNGGSPITVGETQLQDRSDRPYVAPMQSLDYEEIYVSPLDLNIDNGVIVTPYRPTIRMATPAGMTADRPGDTVVLNYLATPILTSVEEAAELSSGEPMLLNADGYWLVSADPLRNWGFMLPDRQDRRFENTYPQTWAAARSATSGQVHTPEGLFTFQIIDPVRDVISPAGRTERSRAAVDGPSDDGQIWYVGTFVPSDSLETEVAGPSGAARVYIALIIALCVVGSAAGAIAIAESRNYRRVLERLAAEDSLTGLANRRSLEERLGHEIDQARRKDRRVTVAFLDVDGFKTINDELGHAAGDQALVDISEVIEANVRSYDVVGRFRAGEPGTGDPLTARIGGDEFVIMFPETPSPEPATSILSRIAAGIRELSWDGRRVSVSVGIASFPDDGTTRDSLLTAADRAMYEAKTTGRDRIVLAGADGPAVG